MDAQSNGKKNAAQKAVELIQEGMNVGLGSGSTTRIAIELLAQRVQTGLRVKAVSSSGASAHLATELGIEVEEFVDQTLDIYLDGADEVDPEFNLIREVRATYKVLSLSTILLLD